MLREISPIELHKLLGGTTARPLLIDVRAPWEHETARLEDSISIPLSSLEEEMAKLEKEQNIVVYCHHGIRSVEAVHMMEEAEFKNVLNLRGGIHAWSCEVDPGVPTY